MSDIASQAFCGPFTETSNPGFQASNVFIDTHYEMFLSRVQLSVLRHLNYVTTRFGRRWSKYKFHWKVCMDGIAPNPETDFAGVPPGVEASRQAYHAAYTTLIEYGILLENEEQRVSICFTKTCFDLAAIPQAVKSWMNKLSLQSSSRNLEGLKRWCQRQISFSTSFVEVETADVEPEQEETPPAPAGIKWKRASSHGFTYKNYTSSQDKSFEELREWGKGIMRKANEVLSSVTNAVEGKRNALRSNRLQRYNMSDRTHLFAEAWQRGQKARSNFAPPSRLNKTDTALLKTQLLKPSEDTTIDLTAMAEWVTENWDAIGGQYFAKAKTYPDNPSFRWFLKCFQQYVVAFEQKDYLDAEATRNTTSLLKRVKAADASDEKFTDTMHQAKDTIQSLRAELAEANRRLTEAEETGNLEPTDFENEMRDITSRMKGLDKRTVKRKRLK